MIFRALLPSASSGNAAEALHASNCQRRWKSWLPGPMVFHMFHMPVTSWPLWMVHGCTILYYDVLLLGVRFFFLQTKVLVSISPGDGSRSMQTCAQNRRAEWPESEQRPIRWCPARWAPSNQLACFRQRTPLTRIRQDTCHIHIIHPKSGAFAAISF